MGGLLLHLSWFPHGFTGLIFIAFVPFLWLAKKSGLSGIRLFTSLFAGFFLFHFLSGFWMYSSTIPGSLLAHLFNATYFSLLIWFWSLLYQKAVIKAGKVSVLLLFWIGFEAFHQHWELAWPWFTLGHAFAEQPDWVQWYAYTGAAGGTAWILLVNAQLTEALLNIRLKETKKAKRNMAVALVMILGPIGISKVAVPVTPNTATQLSVTVVQPNIHPQREKFDGLSPMQQLERALSLAESAVTPETQLLVFPETMLVSEIDEENFNEDTLIVHIRNFMESHPGLTVLSGAFTKRFNNWHPADAKKAIMDSLPYVLYNSALLIEPHHIGVYHKNRLVPLVEKQPFSEIMKPLRQYIERSGGFFGSYGTNNSSRLMHMQNGVAIKAVICFESAFSTYTARGDKAHLIVLITNDGWWKGDAGYMQHLQLARLRAIENQSWIVRAANTGVSAIISPNGSITQRTAYNEQTVLQASIPLQQERSFFAAYPWFAQSFLMLPGLVVVLIAIMRKKLL